MTKEYKDILEKIKENFRKTKAYKWYVEESSINLESLFNTTYSKYLYSINNTFHLSIKGIRYLYFLERSKVYNYNNDTYFKIWYIANKSTVDFCTVLDILQIDLEVIDTKYLNRKFIKQVYFQYYTMYI